MFPSNYDFDSPVGKTIRGLGIPTGDGRYSVPYGHGKYSGQIINHFEFEYYEEYSINNHRQYPITPKEAFSQYNFAKDEQFASQLKAYYGEFRRRSGRSFLMARIAIEHSVQSGKSVYIQDHNYLQSGKYTNALYHFQNIFKEAIDWYNERGCQLSIVEENQERFKIVCRRPDIFGTVMIRDFNPERTCQLSIQKKIKDEKLLLICNIT